MLTRVVGSFSHARCTRNISSRASNILAALDIPLSSEIPGVYDGQWKGSGEVLKSVCPTTGEVLARVQAVSVPTKSKPGSHLCRGHSE